MIKHSKYLKEIGVDPMEGFDEKDPRYKLDKELGFAQSETWNLYYSLALEIYPRLCYFREQTLASPIEVDSKEEWDEILGKMIHAFKLILTDDRRDDEKFKEVEEGLRLFAKWYFALWW